MKSYSLSDSKKYPLDFKLNDIFNKDNGYYIELGAHDGLSQSNTAFFEFFKNWKGILIEPSIDGYTKCKINRPNSIVLNYACISNDYDKATVLGDFNGYLMSSVGGERIDIKKDNYSLVEVPARTLESILNEYHNKDRVIDFLSLDTEGYELNILKGLNLERYRPRYILIEVYSHQYDELVSFLESNQYKLICNFSNYNSTDCPIWDGTHNDYLFQDARI
jgi:FkbM family methyltransferase